jgi:hypothetical protein
MFELQVASYSQLLVFYRAKSHVKLYGYAKNWSSTGYWELDFQPASKFRVKF